MSKFTEALVLFHKEGRIGARDYDPAIGRWTAKDPILFNGGQVGLYVYSMGDAINRFDPSGLASCEYSVGEQRLDTGHGGSSFPMQPQRRKYRPMAEILIRFFFTQDGNPMVV